MKGDFVDTLDVNDGFVQSRKLQVNGRLQTSFIVRHGGPQRPIQRFG